MLLPDLYATELDEDGKVEVVVDDEEEVMEKIWQVLDLEQAARLMEIARKHQPASSPSSHVIQHGEIVRLHPRRNDQTTLHCLLLLSHSLDKDRAP
ncbi:hypothetical protein Pmani_024552 [Petrolisthes manimaculis]|uniref:Uncharacterized protein n=1 Tax=Petrolisthes manimaculis TaxID=1843537 RepID=A0AAE1P9V4_9EUCA|nr:hypothetical protein Pmani_024552 [Petrolisthes manimaculis]